MNGLTYIRWFEDLNNADVPTVGGKNASLGELVRGLSEIGVRVPPGFAATAAAYRKYVEVNSLEVGIRSWLERYQSGTCSLRDAGRNIRELISEAAFPAEIEDEIRTAYRHLAQRTGRTNPAVAVRSSATAEDLPTASFAGQQESFLNIQGEDALLDACKRCIASLYTDRAIVYRETHHFDHAQVSLSVGIQLMVRSDLASAGVMFTLDTESGFPGVVLINGAWGLGENVVKGFVSPDQYLVFKPSLERERATPILEKRLGTKQKKLICAPETSELPGAATINIDTTQDERERSVLTGAEILQLARWGVAIEKHYGCPMDVEWAKDGADGQIYIVQARPETVRSQELKGVFRTYKLKGKGPRLVTGPSIGAGIATGKVCRVLDAADLTKVEPGSILVTRMTDPDWVPVMRRVAGIVTDSGGRTCHAAIVSRELGIPAIVGTGNATDKLTTGLEVTLSCAEGEQGVVYDGILAYETEEVDLRSLPETRTKIMLNMASPDAAFTWWRLPADGVGLARMEFIISQWIKIHPMALVRYEALDDKETRRRIDELTKGYPDKAAYFIDRLASGIAKIAASRYPEPVIVRTSDFKTNEYANLIGGSIFEPEEENPMIGWRGASRYYNDDYREGFALECSALKKAREVIGLDNIAVMIPFCRTVTEADRVLAEMARNGLVRSDNGLEVYMMCEIPSNVVLAEEFARRFDGFSIGSNDLTQLILGIDRDSSRLAYLFDERDEAVLRTIRDVIQRARAVGCKVGICGQAPSDYPEFAAFLIEAGIDSMSLNPDSFVRVKKTVAEAEQRTTARRSRKLAARRDKAIV